MQIKKKKIAIILMVMSVPIFLIGLLFKELNIQWIAILIIYIASIFFSRSNTENGILYLGFLISFFVFLLGRNTLYLFRGEAWNYDLENYQIGEIICLNIYISLFVLFISFQLFKIKNSFSDGGKDKYFKYCKKNMNIFNFARILFYVTVPFALIVNVEILTYGMTHIYAREIFVSSIPWVFRKIAQANSMLFWIILSVLPSKKKLMPIVGVFLGISFLEVFGGSRGGMVTDFMIVILYFFYRQELTRKIKVEEKWISRKECLILVLLVPFALAMLTFYETVRSGNANFSGFIAEFFNFFEHQGGSYLNIGRYEMLKDYMPQTNISYVFGPIINWFRDSIFGNLLNMEVFAAQSLESALYGNNLGSTLTYLLAPDYYFAGGGFGTQYIAELYADFRYGGVALYHIFFGFLLKKANFVTGNYWILNAMKICIISNILFLPRDYALGFVIPILSISNWLILIFVYFFSNIKVKRQ